MPVFIPDGFLVVGRHSQLPDAPAFRLRAKVDPSSLKLLRSQQGQKQLTQVPCILWDVERT